MDTFALDKCLQNNHYPINGENGQNRWSTRWALGCGDNDPSKLQRISSPQGGPRGTKGDPDNRWRLHISSISHTGWQPRAQDILSQNQDAINLMWWVCGYLSEYFRHQWMRRSYLKSWYVSSFYEKSFWSVFIYLWHLLPLQYICFVFTTFPSLRHLVSWEQDMMILSQEKMVKSERQHLEECRFVAPDQNWLWNDPWSKVKLDRTRKHINGGNCYDPYCRHLFIRLTNLDYRRYILLMPAIRY